ncbi:hypothetical protein ACJX0J_023504, partial [Zea mays]
MHLVDTRYKLVFNSFLDRFIFTSPCNLPLSGCLVFFIGLLATSITAAIIISIVFVRSSLFLGLCNRHPHVIRLLLHDVDTCLTDSENLHNAFITYFSIAFL